MDTDAINNMINLVHDHYDSIGTSYEKIIYNIYNVLTDIDMDRDTIISYIQMYYIVNKNRTFNDYTIIKSINQDRGYICNHCNEFHDISDIVVYALADVVGSYDSEDDDDSDEDVVSDEYDDVKISLDISDLKKLKQKKLKLDMDSDCSICLENMLKGQKVILLKCGHTFHKDCIYEHLSKYSYKCPVCRTECGKSYANI